MVDTGPAPTTAHQNGDEAHAAGLVGRWRLVALEARGQDGTIRYSYGKNPRGSLVYTAGGWMTVHLSAADRPPLSSADLQAGSEREQAAAFSSYDGYCGRYEIRGDSVVHHVEIAKFPNWIGSEQIRRFEVAGDELVLRSPPIQSGAAPS